MFLSPWLLGGAGLLLGTPALAQTDAAAPEPGGIIDLRPPSEPLLGNVELGFSARALLGQALLGGSVELGLGRHFVTRSVAGVLRWEAGSGLYALQYQVATTGAQFWGRVNPRLWVGGGPEFGALFLRLPYTQRIEWSILAGGNLALAVHLGRIGRGYFGLGMRADVELVTSVAASGMGPFTVAGTLSLGYHL